MTTNEFREQARLLLASFSSVPLPPGPYQLRLARLCSNIAVNLGSFTAVMESNFSMLGLYQSLPRVGVVLASGCPPDVVAVADQYNDLLRDLRTLVDLYDNSRAI
jgi:hypothetical protein